MNAINARQAEALYALVSRWPGEQVVLVGAAAISCFLELRRMTADIDLTISLSIESYEQELRAASGWSPDPRMEGRWVGPGNVTVDIVPAAPQLLAQGHVIWPRSGRRMSLTGIRLAFAEAVAVDIGSQLTLRVAPLHVLALLKMAAYVERPGEREKDLGDIALIMEGYVDDERRFSDEALDLGLSYPDVAPFLLGADLARLIDGSERAAVREFLAMARDEGDASATLIRMARAAPSEYRDPLRLAERLGALEQGLG